MLTRCKSCLYPTTKPDLHFVDGECAACRNYRNRPQIDWEARRQEFINLIAAAPRGSSGYDCIVPSSGGKDSTFQVLKMIELGFRPLVVTATTCHLTDVGQENIANLARFATTVEFTPNRGVRAALNRLGLATVGDISLPEHFAIFSVPFRAAVDFDIPLIVYGECPTMEYGGPPGSEGHKTMTRRYIMEHQGFLGMRASDFIGTEYITERDMRDYMLPPEEKMEKVTAVFMGQYFPWDSRNNADIAKAKGFTTKLPFSGNWWNFENLDNAQTGLHDFFGYLKYGYSRGTAQMSVDIRTRYMTRDEAEEKNKLMEDMFPVYYMGVRYDEVLSNIGITEKMFWEIVDKFKNKTIFPGENKTRW